MFNQPSLEVRLLDILNEYGKIANGDRNILREMIPPQEMWRFYINGIHQEKGKKLSSYFQAIPDCTIKEFAERENKDWRESGFIKFLKRENWNLSDEACETMKVKDFLLMDTAWMQYENEAGYLKALFLALQESYREEYKVFDVENGIKLIKAAHKLSNGGVKQTNYDQEESEDKVGEFRVTDEMMFGLSPNNTNQNGLCELLQRKHPMIFLRVPLFVPDVDFNIGSIKINLNNIGFYRDFYLRAAKKLRGIDLSADVSEDKLKQLGVMKEIENWIYENREKIRTHIEIDPDFHENFFQLLIGNHRLRGFLHGLAKAGEDADKLSAYIYNLFNHPLFKGYRLSLQSQQHPQHAQAQLEEEMRKLIHSYLMQMKEAKNPIDKLYAIVTYVQSCDQLHPFADGNGRVFYLVLLKHLLEINGFLPPILNNISRLGAISHKDFVKEVIDGMGNTLKLVGEKNLFNVNSNDIMSMLESEKSLQPYANYFKEILDIEENGRKHSKGFTLRDE